MTIDLQMGARVTFEMIKYYFLFDVCFPLENSLSMMALFFEQCFTLQKLNSRAAASLVIFFNLSQAPNRLGGTTVFIINKSKICCRLQKKILFLKKINRLSLTRTSFKVIFAILKKY